MAQGLQTVDQVPEIATDDVDSAGYWLAIARDAYQTSTDYFDANIRAQLEKNVHAFRSKHAPGSKYHSEQYKYRSKIFRPKVRAAVRRAAAACGVALFSTSDAVAITANDTSDAKQVASAAINQELLNYRLDKTIPWFLTSVGAFVDAKVQGVCISKQEWEYDEDIEEFEDGSGYLRERRTVKVDKPTITLIPAENFRFSAAADWIDPVNSSPFLIHLKPMFVGDIQERMANGEYIEYTEQEILAAIDAEPDTTRQSRAGNRTDATQQHHRLRAFDHGWVREYVVRHQGQDVVFSTLGDRLLLEEPRPLADVYHHGIRPFVIGYIDIEPHKSYPAGSPELAEGLQIQANDIANQRIDNVRLALNKRYFAKRGRTVDWNMLRRSIPGGIVMMDEFDSVQAEQVADVTASAYHEQDRVNLDMDEILGSFSNASVMSNRRLGETVGGMNLLNDGANIMTEFELRVFSETWVERVMRQLLLLEQTYENDAVILAIAGQKANLLQKFGINTITDDLLRAELTCRVNVGFGSTNPQQRIERMALGLNTVGQYVPTAMQRLDEEAVISEVMGALGHKDGARFFKPADGQALPPEVQQKMQEMEEELQRLRSGVEVANIRASATIEAKKIDANAKLQGHSMDLEARLQDSQMDRQSRAEVEHIRGGYALQIADMRARLEQLNTQIRAADSETKRGELRLQANALQVQIADKEREMDERIAALSSGPAGVIQRDDYGAVPHAIG